MASAIFQDTYFGRTEMTLASFKTSRGGSKVVRYRWTPVTAKGCITTGFVSAGFASVDQAIAAAGRHAQFSEVRAA